MGVFICPPARDRTWDRQLKRLLLYHLSYRREYIPAIEQNVVLSMAASQPRGVPNVILDIAHLHNLSYRRVGGL